VSVKTNTVLLGGDGVNEAHQQEATGSSGSSSGKMTKAAAAAEAAAVRSNVSVYARILRGGNGNGNGRDDALIKKGSDDGDDAGGVTKTVVVDETEFSFDGVVSSLSFNDDGQETLLMSC